MTAPDSTCFYAYNGNKTSHTVTGTFSNDFTLVTSSNVLTQANLVGLLPGDVMAFALEIPNVTTSTSLSIKQLKSNDSNRQGLSQNRFVADGIGDKYINIGWAIDIYSLVNTTGTGYSTFVESATGKITPAGSDGSDRFNYTYSTNRSFLETGFDAETKIKTLADNALIPIDSFSGSADKVYIFFTIVFSTKESILYNEVDSKSVDADVITDSPNDGNRFFKQSNTGKSNCYAGLSFAIPEMKIVTV